MARYTNRTEAIEREIIGPIEAEEKRASLFDIGAIANQVLLSHEDGYQRDPDVDFWDIVCRNSL